MLSFFYNIKYYVSFYNKTDTVDKKTDPKKINNSKNIFKN